MIIKKEYYIFSIKLKLIYIKWIILVLRKNTKKIR